MTKDEERDRRPMTIEQLLVWAYFDQMVHQAQRGRSALTKRSSAPIAATSSIWSEGAHVESSRNQGFEANEDAWRIHDQVMKLGTIKVDCGQDLAAMRYHALGQYSGAAPPIGNRGAVDNTARGSTTAQPWPTHGVLDIDVRVLVMLHASRQTRPQRDLVAAFRFKPGQLVRHPKQRGGVYARGWFSHVSVEGVLPGDVLQARQLYDAWRNGLIQLRDALASIRLTMFSVKPDIPLPF